MNGFTITNFHGTASFEFAAKQQVDINHARVGQ